MKLIKQCKLFFKEGKSDKVYEIDLCELTADQFLVNFRYGRRGSTLKEGTKTPAAVSPDEAESLFAALEAEKRKKGYQTENEVFIELPSLDAVNPDSAAGVILHRLQDAIEGKNSFKTVWKTSRVIWKAGWMGLQEATPFIIKLASKGDELQTHAALHALVRLKATQAEELFRSYATMTKQKQYIRNMAHEGLLTILKDEKRQTHIATLIESVPTDIRYALDTHNTDLLQTTFTSYTQKETVGFMAHYYLACKDKPEAIHTAIEVMKKWELRPPFFRQIRAVYKLAQVRGDMNTVAALAYMFEKTPRMFNRTMSLDESYPQYFLSLEKQIVVGKELRREDSRLAYSNFTKNHLQLNSLDFIKETGARKEAKEYLRLAIATLLQYTDEDYTPQEERLKSNYGTYNWDTREYHYIWTNYAECTRSLMLSTILFGNDPNRIFEKNMSFILGRCYLKSSSYSYKENQMTETCRTGMISKSFPKQTNAISRTNATSRTGSTSQTNKASASSGSFFGSIKKLFGKKEQAVPIEKSNTNETANQGTAGYQGTGYPDPANQPTENMEARGLQSGNNAMQSTLNQDKTKRPELYPEHWDAMPESYIVLLMKSPMKRIQQFAFQNLSQHARYEEISDSLSNNDLLLLFDTGCEYPAKLAMHILTKRNETLAADSSFVMSLLSVKNSEARAWTRQVIDRSVSTYVANTDYIFALVFNPYDDCAGWIDRILQQTHCSNEQLQVLLGKSVSELLQWEDTPENNQRASKAIKRLNNMAAQHYSHISWDVVTHLMSSELQSNIIFAGDIIVRKTEWGRPEEVPLGLVRLFLEHPIPEAREKGIALLAQYPDHFIRDHQDDFVRLANTAYKDVLVYVLNRIRFIAQTNKEFGQTAIHHLVYVLVRKAPFEDAHLQIRDFITGHLRDFWNSLRTKDIITLIHANYRDSQLTGYEILKNYDKPNDFSVRQIVSLGNHEILAIRQWCWNYFKNNTARIRYERDKALFLLDSKWDDTRAFAFHYFQTEFTEADWDTETLIAITDSVRPDVEKFGKELITQHFKPENALEYLTKLSEHPSTSIQLFISNYLTLYATDNPEKIKELEYYFRSTLTRVNKGRVAKDRIFTFLRQEALKNEEAARVITAIIDDLSAQTTVQDKATCIEILTGIKNRYPASDMHLTVIQ